MRWRPAMGREQRMDCGDDGPGFETQVLPHLDAAYNLARWLVRDPSLAQDVVQDAMLRALRYFPSLRGDARPWLLRIVRNAAYDAMAVPAETIQDLPDPVDPGDTPEDALVRRESLAMIDRVLESLPVVLRECLVLRELEGLSYEAITQVTGAPLGTVMSRLFRARQMILQKGTP